MALDECFSEKMDAKQQRIWDCVYKQGGKSRRQFAGIPKNIGSKNFSKRFLFGKDYT